MRKVEDISLKGNETAREILRKMERSGGFQAKNVAIAGDIIKRMINDRNSFNFLSFPADIIATGARGIIKDFVKKRFFDVLITTCGTLDHDLARSYKDYFHGSFDLDDSELHRKKINRLGNILIPNESYGEIIEKEMTRILKEIYSEGKNNLATYELVWEIGKRIKNKNSILYWCWKNKIPMIVPGITDGAVGYQIWQFSQDHKFSINLLKDEQLISDRIWNTKRSGALVIGGGISKHHTIWWNQFKRGLDYAVYISTSQEFDGSLSGARPHEAISWGKINEKAKFVSVNADATIVLPLIASILF